MNAWQITKKDLRLLVRDRRTLFILVVLPMAFISILGFSTGQLFSEREKTRRVRVAVVDEDKTPAAEQIRAEAAKLQALAITDVDSAAEANQMLAEGNVDVIVVIGAHYHERVAELELGDVFFVEEGRLAGKLGALDIEVKAGSFYANAAEIVQELVFAFARGTITPAVIRSRNPLLAARLLREARETRASRSPDADQERPAAAAPAHGPRGNIVYQVLVPSYTVMFVFFVVNFMARSFISERDIGTLNRLRIAPVTRTGRMLGKTAPFLVTSLVQTVLLFLGGKALFGMSWGPQPWLLVPVMLCTSLAATTLGLLVATTVRTDSQVSAYGNFLVLTMAGISGCLMPRSWQPELMRQIGLFTPHAWSLIAYDQILNQETPFLPVVWRSCLVLAGFALAFFAIGWWRFRTLD